MNDDDKVKDLGCSHCGTETCLLLDPPAPTHNTYESRKAARIERLRARAERLGREATASVERARAMASVIPFGQPILVGHYSEGRDRRYRARIDSTFRKGFEAHKEAESAARRADAAESNRAVSSDDPKAVVKLREKLVEEERRLDATKAANKHIRAGRYVDAVKLLDWWPDPVGRLAILKMMGHTTVSTTNGAATIRRLQARITLLEERAAAPAKAPEALGAVTIEERENRVRCFFPGKPSDAVRTHLKRNGFRWSPTAGAWQAYPSFQAWEAARKAAAMVGSEA